MLLLVFLGEGNVEHRVCIEFSLARRIGLLVRPGEQRVTRQQVASDTPHPVRSLRQRPIHHGGQYLFLLGARLGLPAG